MEVTMAQQLTLKEILEQAIEKEISSRNLYHSLRQRVANQAAKDVLQSLADQEERHRQFLEDYMQGKLKDGAMHSGLVVDYKVADYLEKPEITPGMELKEIFLLSAKREKASYDLYTGLAAIHPAGQVKHLLEDLAVEELRHKQRVETLYSEVAFPQTDGG
jgi:rubrerythrin